MHPLSRPRIARRGHAALASRQRGVSLIISMIMLVVIGLVSVGIMRAATSSDQVAMNNRLQTQASQYAQAALQFCESQLAAAGGGGGLKVVVTVLSPQTPPAWTVPANWLNAGTSVYRLQALDLPATNAPVVYPQCLVETNGSDPGGRLFTVTSRGFSNDYSADANGVTKSGSVVWLQSSVLAY